MRVAVQGLRMERNRRLLWDMVKIIFNSLMTILIFGLLIGMGNCSYAKHLPHVWTGLVEVRFVWPVNLKSWLFWVIKVNGWNRIDFPDKVFALVSLFMQLILAKLIRFWNITILLGRKNFSESDFMNIPGEIGRKSFSERSDFDSSSCCTCNFYPLSKITAKASKHFLRK